MSVLKIVKTGLLVLAAGLILIATVSGSATACKNLDLNVGVLDTVEGRLFAQIMATFIHERTAVKTGIYYYQSMAELEEAIDQKKVQIIVEDANAAIAAMGAQPDADPAVTLAVVKEHYRTTKGLLWLAPFEFNGEHGLRAPIIRQQLLTKFPALPRVLSKLTRSINDTVRSELLTAVKEEGKKLSSTAKDFLLDKRLI